MKAYQDEVVSSALDGGTISTALRRWLKVTKDANVNSIINFPVQATVADGFKMVLIELDKRLADPNSELALL